MASAKNEHASVIYGKRFPCRLFVGCLPESATANELGEYFTRYGKVEEAKVLMDDCGKSKRYGFVSFSSEGSVKKVLDERPISFKGKIINVGPAVKKDGQETAKSVSPVNANPDIAKHQNKSASPTTSPVYSTAQRSVEQVTISPQVSVSRPVHVSPPHMVYHQVPVLTTAQPTIPFPLMTTRQPATTAFATLAGTQNQRPIMHVYPPSYPEVVYANDPSGFFIPFQPPRFHPTNTLQYGNTNVPKALDTVFIGKKFDNETRYDPNIFTFHQTSKFVY